MAAKRVESYLDYHKIGPLFEDLMAKLIKEMPDQPIPFLVRLLKKHSPEEIILHSRPPSGSKSRSPMSSSMSLSGKQFTRQSQDESRENRRNVLAKSWTAPDTRDRPTSATKSREYNKPWLTGSKKVRGEQSELNKENTKHGIKRTDERPGSWNADTKIPFNDFDEWFEAQNKKQKNGVPSIPTNKEPRKSWQDDRDDLDTSMDKRGIGYPLAVNASPTQPPSLGTDGDLEGEAISFSRHRKTTGETSEGNSVASYSSSGRYSKKNARHASKEHRKQLESLLLNNDSCQSQHHNKLSDEDKDDATELLESSNELENEGVLNPANSGYKLSKNLKSQTSSQESVKISICARCARIITGMSSEQQSDVSPSAGSILSNGTDDDFESVSQAGSMTGGPARITWPSGFDSENDTVTPRNNKPMWNKPDTKSPKGKHMYNRNSSTFLTDLVGSPSPRPTSAASRHSDNTFTPRPGKGWQQKSGEYSSDNDTDVKINYGRKSPSTTRFSEGKPWSRPLENTSDAGSEDWIPDRGKKVNFKSKGFRQSYLTDDSDY